jgi:hypothetical protein
LALHAASDVFHFAFHLILVHSVSSSNLRATRMVAGGGLRTASRNDEMCSPGECLAWFVRRGVVMQWYPTPIQDFYPE